MKVLVTTSGVGSRLGDYTKFTNKSLVPVGDEPGLSRIIRSYPQDVEFVITIGYRAQLVKQFLELAFPNLHVTLVEVDRYQGPGSSLGYSMLCAKDYLQEPFIYNAGDTLVSGVAIPEPNQNWLGASRGTDGTLYATLDVSGENVVKCHEKGMTNFDFQYIGLAGIFSYEKFWQTLADLHESDSAESTLNDLMAVSRMILEDETFRVEVFDEWNDIGSLPGLAEARRKFGVSLPTLEKNDEAIFLLGDNVLKFFADERVAARRVERAQVLGPVVPPITNFRANWYSYAFVEGRPLSKVVDERVFENLLEWAQTSLWLRPVDAVNPEIFNATCEEFYFDKTRARIEAFLHKSGFRDEALRINGLHIPTVSDCLEGLRESHRILGRPGLMHGDFILDNIVMSYEEDFVAIDWRQGFGDLLSVGDINYDLAKLRHSLTMNHDILLKGQFVLERTGSQSFNVDILRSSTLFELEKVLDSFMTEKGYDLETVKVLTPLIWINMAPLHPHPLDAFLFLYGRLWLWKSLAL